MLYHTCCRCGKKQ